MHSRDYTKGTLGTRETTIGQAEDDAVDAYLVWVGRAIACMVIIATATLVSAWLQ